MDTPVIIPLVDARSQALPVPRTAGGAVGAATLVADTRGRMLRDLRISVTDRCNFRCGYCMPKAVFGRDHPFLRHDELLSFEEITHLARVFLGLGVHKLRITGGEPLLRKHVEHLIEQLASLKTLSGSAPELTLTTNASLLARKARDLKAAGLDRVTVSLDAIDDAIFRRMNDMDFPVAHVLKGIDAAQDAGLGPIKVNMVVRRGLNDSQILPMARHFRSRGVTVRFIEYMDVGVTNGWRMDEVVPSAQVIARIQDEFPLHPLEPTTAGETAQRWAYDDGAGEIGVISSVTQAFCHTCNRARLSMEGRLFLCLFADAGYDLRALLRQGADVTELRNAVAGIWMRRTDHYSELRGSAAAPQRRRVEMSYIGG